MANYKKMHISCDHCGSSDAAVINEDDSKYCFKCNVRDKPQNGFNMPTLPNVPVTSNKPHLTQNDPYRKYKKPSDAEFRFTRDFSEIF